MPEKLEIADELIAERRAGVPGELPDDMPNWMAVTITAIDWFSLWTGRLVCWLIVPLFLAMVYEVIARKFFLAPTLWAYDMSRFLYGALFMLGAGYALSRGVHIRADFIYRNWSARTQGIVDATLYILFYFPGLLTFLFMSTDFAY
ncbi:MAG: TRAP transporter small permease subunit, partial [Candidatus Competibacteraceae bacterium]|nr:TRAP transporter small permease subunit [Candidatus Competibacteraceae bacterium]